MELRVLKYFLAIAREQGITRAAEVLHITQPTLSRQIAELEEELGVQLFDRSGRRIQLTDEGILFRRRALEILELVDRTREEMTKQDERIEGTVSIGCGVLHAFQMLSEVIGRFRERYPQVHFQIHTGNADDVRQRIDQGLLDLALFIEPVAVETYNYVRFPEKELYGVMLPADSPLAAKEAVTVDDLAGLPLCLPSRLSVHSEVMNWFQSAKQPLNIPFTSNLSTNAAMLVAHHLAVAIIALGSQPYADPAKIALRPLAPELAETAILAWRRQQPYTRAVKKFIAFAQEEIPKTSTSRAE